MHRIPLPLPNDALRAVNVYAIESGDDLVLVDAGWALAETGGLLDAALDQIGRNSAQITRCLVTHVHRDHYTMAVILRRRFGTRVALGIGDRPSLTAAGDAEREHMAEHVLRLERAGRGTGDPRTARRLREPRPERERRVGAARRVAQGSGPDPAGRP